MEVADEDDELSLILRLVRVEIFEGDIVPIFVLDEDFAGLAKCLWIGQLTMSRFLFVRGTHDVLSFLSLADSVGPDAFYSAGMKRVVLSMMTS